MWKWTLSRDYFHHSDRGVVTTENVRYFFLSTFKKNTHHFSAFSVVSLWWLRPDKEAFVSIFYITSEALKL